MSTTTASNVAKKIEEQRFEFVLYINKHIVCQRYFNIRDYNEDSPYSIEIKELMDRLVGMNNVGRLGMIPNRLKNKSIEYLWKNYNPYYQQKPEVGKNNFEKLDTFDFEIKVDKNIVAQSTFSGNFFPPQVRYQVDIKEIIPDIITEIKDALSANKYTTNYADVVL